MDIQGDEPLLSPKHIDRVVNYHFKNPKYEIVLPTLKIKSLINQNLIKVITDLKNNVLYLSRAQIHLSLKIHLNIFLNIYQLFHLNQIL